MMGVLDFVDEGREGREGGEREGSGRRVEEGMGEVEGALVRRVESREVVLAKGEMAAGESTSRSERSEALLNDDGPVLSSSSFGDGSNFDGSTEIPTKASTAVDTSGIETDVEGASSTITALLASSLSLSLLLARFCNISLNLPADKSGSPTEVPTDPSTVCDLPFGCSELGGVGVVDPVEVANQLLLFSPPNPAPSPGDSFPFPSLHDEILNPEMDDDDPFLTVVVDVLDVPPSNDLLLLSPGLPSLSFSPFTPDTSISPCSIG
jgi:hypothetical protein